LKVFYRSSRSEEVYETEVLTAVEADSDRGIWSCTCPSFQNRGTCGHCEQVTRWVEWGAEPPPNSAEKPLDPPPPMGSWRKEVRDGT
jgi:hypothetical protein